VDKQKLVELQQYLPLSSLIDLLAMFNAESGVTIAHIHESLLAGDYKAIGVEAHGLVSTAGNLGAMEVSRRARALEHACRNEAPAELGRLVSELDQALEAANTALKAWIEQTRPLQKAG
jgi:HPt (histidine-containing phosphotransfer) domain-containing protein